MCRAGCVGRGVHRSVSVQPTQHVYRTRDTTHMQLGMGSIFAGRTIAHITATYRIREPSQTEFSADQGGQLGCCNTDQCRSARSNVGKLFFLS